MTLEIQRTLDRVEMNDEEIRQAVSEYVERVTRRKVHDIRFSPHQHGTERNRTILFAKVDLKDDDRPQSQLDYPNERDFVSP